MHCRFNHKWVLQTASFWRLKCWQTKNCPDSREFATKWYQMCRKTTGCMPSCLSNAIPNWMPWIFTRYLYSIAISVCGKEYQQKISISISSQSNDASNKARGISVSFAVRISIANASSGIWPDMFSVEIHWKSYPMKYESFSVDLSVNNKILLEAWW